MRFSQEPGRQRCPKFRYPKQPPPGTLVPRPKESITVGERERAAAEQDASGRNDLRNLVYRAPEGREAPPTPPPDPPPEIEFRRPRVEAERPREPRRGRVPEPAPVPPPAPPPSVVGRPAIPLSLVRLVKRRMLVCHLREVAQQRRDRLRAQIADVRGKLSAQESDLADCEALLQALSALPDDKEIA
jgi:hypothetical protein